MLKEGFESSSGTTPEFLLFCKTFKSELFKLLRKAGCKDLVFNRGHFYVFGFFTSPSGQIYYYNLNDVRGMNHYSGYTMMYRTATSYKDYTGGSNQWVTIDENCVTNMNLK